MKYPYRLTFVAPNKYKYDVSILSNRESQIFDGKQYFKVNKDGSSDIPIQSLDYLLFFHSLFYGVFANKENDHFNFEYVGRDTVEGTPTYKLNLMNMANDTTIVQVNQKNFSILSIEGCPYQPNIRMSVKYRGYELCKGDLLPYKIERMTPVGPETIYMEKVDFDPVVDESIFIRAK